MDPVTAAYVEMTNLKPMLPTHDKALSAAIAKIGVDGGESWRAWLASAPWHIRNIVRRMRDWGHIHAAVSEQVRNRLICSIFQSEDNVKETGPRFITEYQAVDAEKCRNRLICTAYEGQ